MSRATTLVAVAQQLSLSTGVAVGALVVEITLRLKHGTAMGAMDFPPAFLAVGALSASAALHFCAASARRRRELVRPESSASSAVRQIPQPADVSRPRKPRASR